MKRTIITLFSLIVSGTIIFSQNGIKTQNINIDKSTITWEGRKVTGSHDGTVRLKSGTLVFEDNKLKGGTFVIDMTSIVVTDLTGKSKDNLESHLKSDDFFGIDNYPEAKLLIKKVVSLGTDGDYRIHGDLTIKGTTNPIKFDAKLTANSATASIVVDRSEYNIRYGSGSFFDNLGDKTIYDDFKLEVKLVF